MYIDGAADKLVIGVCDTYIYMILCGFVWELLHPITVCGAGFWVCVVQVQAIINIHVYV